MFVNTRLIRGFTEITNLFDMIEGHGVICGGYARYCASPNVNPAPTNDVDVYAFTDEDFVILKGLIRRHLRIKEENPVSLIFERGTSGHLAYCPEINLVKPMKKGRMITVGDVASILGNFDFTVARTAVISSEACLVDEDFLVDESALRLRLKNIHCPISSTLRCSKYVSKGYWLRPYDVLDLFKDWDQRGPEYKAEITTALGEIEDAIGRNEMLPPARITAIYELMKVD